MELRKQIRSKLDSNMLVEDAVYECTLIDHQVDWYYTLSTETGHRHKYCFLGKYVHRDVDHEEEKGVSNLVSGAQIICINDIDCDGIGYRKVMDVMCTTPLPHTYRLRKTFGIEMGSDSPGIYEEKEDVGDHEHTNHEQSHIAHQLQTDMDYDSDSVSIAESIKDLIAEASPSTDVTEELPNHCPFCPDEDVHPWLFVVHRSDSK